MQVPLGDAVELKLGSLLRRLTLPPVLVPLGPLLGHHRELARLLHAGFVPPLVGGSGEEELPDLDAGSDVHVLRRGALTHGPRPEVVLRHLLVFQRLFLRVRQVRLVHVHAVALHVGQHLAKLPEVVHVKIPEVGASSKRRLLGQHRTRLAVDTSELSLQRLAQEPRRLRVQGGVLDPRLPLLGIGLDLVDRRQDHRLTRRPVLLELGLSEDLLHPALAADQLLASLGVHLSRVRHHLGVGRQRLERVPALELAVAVPQPRHVHGVRGEPRQLHPVVLDDVPVETVVVPHLLHVRRLEVGLEDLPTLLAEGHGVHPQQRLGLLRLGSRLGARPEIHIRTAVHGEAGDAAVAHRALVAHVDVRHLGVHGVVHRSVRVARVGHEDLQHSLRFRDVLDDGHLLDESREVRRLVVVRGGRYRALVVGVHVELVHAGRRASTVAVSVGLVQRDLVAVEPQDLRGLVVVLLVAVRALHRVVRERNRAPHGHGSPPRGRTALAPEFGVSAHRARGEASVPRRVRRRRVRRRRVPRERACRPSAHRVRRRGAAGEVARRRRRAGEHG
mmetsp:Transcript_4817/g.19819  ORF Transcript_4817/g.19819 Transcript_4817/m.19819 type:complete len:559 (+) Transcript_4817:1405-3081(+)